MKKESKQSKLGLPQIIHFCVKILMTRQVWDKDRQTVLRLGSRDLESLFIY